MIRWKAAKVIAIRGENKDIQELDVQIESDQEHRTEQAVNYPSITGPATPGDRVILNTTAVHLNLGTGGKHFVAWVEGREQSGKQKLNGHIMKLRYTPYQIAVMSCEEENSPHHHVLQGEGSGYENTEKDMSYALQSTPVLIGELHSMLPILVARLYQHHRSGGEEGTPLRLAYVMTDGAALPIFLSEHVAMLKKLGWLTATITTGHAFGGDYEAVNVYSGLLAAKRIVQADIMIICMGPGVVGTGTALGFSGMELGENVNAVNSLGGIPVIVPRISFAESRSRHVGVSHHTITALNIAATTAGVLLYPQFADQDWRLLVRKQLATLHPRHLCMEKLPPVEEELLRLLALYPLSVTTMGRSLYDDPAFFQSVALTADLAYFLYGMLQTSDKRKGYPDPDGGDPVLIFRNPQGYALLKTLLQSWSNEPIP